MSQEKEKIINFCREEFFKNGLKNVTMDYVAKNLKISKKTIYKLFSSKDELIMSVIDNFTATVREGYIDIVSSDETTIVKLKKVYFFIVNFLLKAGDNWIKEIKYYNPQIWEKIDNFRTALMYEQLGKIIEQGKREEVIVDIPNEIIITVLISGARGVINPEFLLHNNFSANVAATHTLTILFNGIFTKKGRKILKEIKLGE